MVLYQFHISSGLKSQSQPNNDYTRKCILLDISELRWLTKLTIDDNWFCMMKPRKTRIPPIVVLASDVNRTLEPLSVFTFNESTSLGAWH